MSLAAAGEAEELARAELYGLLARLWLAPPDRELLRQFKVAATGAQRCAGHLGVPWQMLVDAMGDMRIEEATAEFAALFQGVGKPDVFVYGSYYLSGFLNEQPLAALRSDLRRLMLTREETCGETEDHVSYLFEVMRYLIAGDDAAACNLEQQRRFFRTHLQPWVEQLCDAVDAHPRAMLWHNVAALTRAFMQVETQGFDLLELKQ